MRLRVRIGPARWSSVCDAFCVTWVALCSMRPKLRMVHWNSEGFKVGLCSEPPLNQPYSLLGLANNCCIREVFSCVSLLCPLVAGCDCVVVVVVAHCMSTPGVPGTCMAGSPSCIVSARTLTITPSTWTLPSSTWWVPPPPAAPLCATCIERFLTRVWAPQANESVLDLIENYETSTCHRAFVGCAGWRPDSADCIAWHAVSLRSEPSCGR